MNPILRKKIETYHGWDFCDHGRIRNFCPECKWDVPAYMRKEEMPDLRSEAPQPLPLDNIAS